MATTQAKFNPFETYLDLDRSLNTLQQACMGGDDGELFLERSRAQSLLFDDRRMQNSSYMSIEGFGLRAVIGETSGYAHSSEISEESLKRAADTTRFALGNGGGQLAPSPAHSQHKLYSGEDPNGAVSFQQKVELLKSIDAYARDADSRVVQARIGLDSSLQEVVILRPDGKLVTDQRPMVQLKVSIIVEQNGNRNQGGSGQGGRYTIDRLMASETWQPIVDEALRVALVGLDAEPAPAGVFDVVLGPGWTGVLLHEAIGHGLEGDFNRKGTSAFTGLIGKRIASSGVTVVDDAVIKEERGSIAVDDEGTAGQRTTLIEDGILVGYLQDRQNARLTGVESTGNGRRQSYAHSPMPRMTSTYMLAGLDNPKDMVADLKDGIYAVGFGGGQVEITSGKFVFSCTEAYRVKNGKIGDPVKNATLIGDGATALKHIRSIGNDLELDKGLGLCGKNNQWVPVNVGLPSLYIGGLTIGGQST